MPADVFSVVRAGADLLHEYKRFEEGYARFIVSVDETENAFWVSQGGGGITLPISMSCLGTQAICWAGGEGNVQLRNDAGTVLRTVSLPGGNHDDRAWAMQVFADPKDSSVWAFLARSARLVHVDRDGTIRQDLQLADPQHSFSVRMAADFDHRAIWFTRAVNLSKMELVRIELKNEMPQFQVMTENVIRPQFMVPDLNGGLWVLSEQSLSRMDGSGRTLFTIALDKT